MGRHGKTYRGAREKIDRERAYSPAEAVKLLKSLEGPKFDETVEAHFNLGLNVRHAEQQLRGTISLPHGTGREQRVAVFAEGEKAREAEEAGADIVGAADLAKRVEEGFTDFDVAIATPDLMGQVGRLGRVLGPRGLMPNPKTGTVTMDVGKAVREAKAGKQEYRTDRGANVHVVARQEELRGARAARELRGARRRDRPGEARGGEGPLHPPGHVDHDDGPGHQARSVPHARDRRGGRRGGRAGPGVDPQQQQPVARDSWQSRKGRKSNRGGPVKNASRLLRARLRAGSSISRR